MLLPSCSLRSRSGRCLSSSYEPHSALRCGSFLGTACETVSRSRTTSFCYPWIVPIDTFDPFTFPSSPSHDRLLFPSRRWPQQRPVAAAVLVTDHARSPLERPYRSLLFFLSNTHARTAIRETKDSIFLANNERGIHTNAASVGARDRSFAYPSFAIRYRRSPWIITPSTRIHRQHPGAHCVRRDHSSSREREPYEAMGYDRLRSLPNNHEA